MPKRIYHIDNLHYKTLQSPTENFIKNNFVPFVPRNPQGTKEALSGCKIQNFSF